jgi:hypothetical protein
MSHPRMTKRPLHPRPHRPQNITVLLRVTCLLLAASLFFPAAARDTHTLFMGGGGGTGGLPPLLGNAPGILSTTPVDPSTRVIMAQITTAHPHHRVVLRSPDGRRVVMPVRRTASGLSVFVVGENSHWLLTVIGSNVVDLPISAGQDVTLSLP